MNQVVDFFTLDQFFPLVALIALLWWVGQHFADQTINRWAKCFAGAAFIGFGILATATESPETAWDFLLVAIRALLAAGLAAGMSLIGLPAVGYLYRKTVGRAVATTNNWSERMRRRFSDQADARRQRRQDAAARRAFDRDAPRRERERLAAVERLRIAQQEKGRRTEARAACQLMYDLLAPEIQGRFTREQFNGFLHQYLSDTTPVDQVERRAGQLQDLLRQHLERVDPASGGGGFEELNRRYEKRRQEIETLPDERLRRMLLAQLKNQYAQLLSQQMENPFS